jgi:multidrug resistance efflux pump
MLTIEELQAKCKALRAQLAEQFAALESARKTKEQPRITAAHHAYSATERELVQATADLYEATHKRGKSP